MDITNPLISATALNVHCLKLFGSDFYNWDPDTVKSELGTSVPEINLDKIQAVSTLVTTETFYRYWEVFEKIGNCFCCNEPRFDTVTPLRPEECIWAMIEAKLNDETYGPYYMEVIEYVKQVFKHEGVVVCPNYMNFLKLPKVYMTSAQKTEQESWLTDTEEYIKKRLQKIQEEIGTEIPYPPVLDDGKLIIDLNNATVLGNSIPTSHS